MINISYFIVILICFVMSCIALWVISSKYVDLDNTLEHKIADCVLLENELNEQPLGIEPEVFETVMKENKRLQEQNEELANYIKAIISRYTMKNDILIVDTDIEKVKYAQLYKDRELLCKGYFLRVIYPENFIESRKETR